MTKNQWKKMTILTGLCTVALIGCGEQEQTIDPLSKEDSQAWADGFEERILVDDITVREAVEELADTQFRVTNTDATKAVEALVSTLEFHANRYNESLALNALEVDTFLETYPDIDFASNEGWKKVEDGVVKGLHAELNGLPYKWTHNEAGLTISVDYDKVFADHEGALLPVMKNKLAFYQAEADAVDIDPETLIPNFESFWSHMALIESFNEDIDDELEDDLYFYTMRLYGFGEKNMFYSDGTIYTDAVDDMRAVATEHSSHATAKNMLKIADKIEETNDYGDDVLDYVNDLLNVQFEAYLVKVEARIAQFEAEEEANEEAKEESKSDEESKDAEEEAEAPADSEDAGDDTNE